MKYRTTPRTIAAAVAALAGAMAAMNAWGHAGFTRVAGQVHRLDSDGGQR